jgi:hypothetical protein
MKKLILFTILFASIALSQSNNVDTTVASKVYFRDTLTASIDTIDVLFANPDNWGYHTIMAVNPSGVDTVEVYAKALDGSSNWSRHAVIRAEDDSVRTSIVTSTTAKEWILFGTHPQKVRLISTSEDASTTIILLGVKKGNAP